MAVNDPTSQSSARRPRAAAAVDGVRLPGLLELEVGSTMLQAPDSFHATLALAALPASYGWSYWASLDQAGIELFAGFLADGEAEADAALASLILGTLDRIEIDALAMVVRLSGRDLSAPLFENRTSEKFVNQTSSQIAATLALRRGLVPVVTPTASPSGRLYELETARLSREMIEWDILSTLAREEGYDLFVTGNKLYFQPPTMGGNRPYLLRYAPPAAAGAASGNFLALRLERDLMLAGGISLAVKSWNAKTCTALVTTLAGGSGAGGPHDYSCVMPGLRPDQAAGFGKTFHTALTRHERALSVTLPGDTVLTPRTPLVLEGTGSAFDQSYLVDRIDRRFSFEGGFTMEVHAKNVSPAAGEAS